MDKEEIIELDIRNEAQEVAALLQKLQQSNAEGILPEEQPPEPAAPPDESKWQQIEERRVRVDVAVLNNLVNLSSEMVLARNQLLHLLTGSVDKMPGLRAVLQKIDYTTTKLQENIMQTRMQPIATLFNSAPRMVRELSKTLGKKVDLVVDGHEVELDRSIIEGLKDPFAHLIRNAMDHGIETSSEREKAGKPFVAVLRIKAYNESGRVIIDITDDGAGINVLQVKRKALEKNLLTPEQAKTIGESQLLKMIFLPGFSTNNEINNISGRGVGLDVVHANIERLGGTVEVLTRNGKGTTFRLVLPLSLAIIPSLLVETVRHQFALPQACLREIVRIVPDGQHKLEFIQGRCVLRLRGRLIPVVQLSEAIGVPSVPLQMQTGIKRVLILKKGNRSFGLLVDKINDREDILVKPIPSYLKEKAIYSGVTILGDGKIAMVLDADGIATAAHIAEAERQLAVETAAKPADTGVDGEKVHTVLLFQALGPETFGVKLSEVARVEKIRSETIELIGGKEYYNSDGAVLRLIRPENCLPASSVRPVSDKVYVIIPKNSSVPIGITAARIKDTVQTELHFAPSVFTMRGLLGSIIVEGKVVLLLSITKLAAMVKEPPTPDLEMGTTE